MQKEYYEYFCHECYQNGFRDDIFLQDGLIVRSVLFNKKKFIILQNEIECEPVEIYLNIDKKVKLFQSQDDPFYLCSYLTLKCDRCDGDIGIILKATTEYYIYFREKILLFYDKVEVVEQNQVIQQNNQNNNDNYQEILQQNMNDLNENLSQYQDLIQRQGQVEEGLINLTKIIEKLVKKI